MSQLARWLSPRLRARMRGYQWGSGLGSQSGTGVTGMVIRGIIRTRMHTVIRVTVITARGVITLRDEQSTLRHGTTGVMADAFTTDHGATKKRLAGWRVSRRYRANLAENAFLQRIDFVRRQSVT